MLLTLLKRFGGRDRRLGGFGSCVLTICMFDIVESDDEVLDFLLVAHCDLLEVTAFLLQIGVLSGNLLILSTVVIASLVPVGLIGHCVVRRFYWNMPGST